MPRGATRPMLTTGPRAARLSRPARDSVGRYGTNRSDRVARVRLRLDVGDERLDLIAHERLFLEQRAGDPVECASVLAQQAQGLVVGFVGEASLLLVAQALRLLGERVVVGAHRPRADDLGHAELEDHLA